MHDLTRYASHSNPAADYGDAIRRIESKLAGEVDFNPDAHSFVLTHSTKTERAIVFAHGYLSSPAPFKTIASEFYGRGYNVLAVTMPYHGLANRMTTEHAKLRMEDFIRYGDEVVDIARGLGDHVTIAGISCGALVTGWTAQQRNDVDLAVLISPGFGFKAVPRVLRPAVGWAWRVLPNWYIWDDPTTKAHNPRPDNYPRLSTRALGQIVRFSRVINALARQAAPAAGAVLVITNLNDPAVDNVATSDIVGLWRARRADDVQTYQFPANLGLGHDIISMTDPNMTVAVVYPQLLELIDR